MTRSCTFQALVYIYIRFKYREKKRKEEEKGARTRESERVRQCNHYHTVDCHAKVRRTITIASLNSKNEQRLLLAHLQISPHV
jgi:hypothetical protein